MAVSDRVGAWLRQVESDLAQARESLTAGRAEWACYAASQAGEKVVKAGLIALAADEVWGHNVAALLTRLAKEAEATCPAALLDDAKILTQFNVLSRYPVGDAAMAPVDLMTRAQAAEAIAAAERLTGWVNEHVLGAETR